MNADPSSGQVLSPWRARLALSFGLLWGFALVISVVPRTWFPRTLVQPALDRFQGPTGTQQDWAMFNSIPGEHRIRFVVELDDGREFGAIVPGLESWPRERSRGVYTMHRMLDAANPVMREAWIERLREEARSRGASSFRLRIERQLIRHLYHSRQDGRIATEVINSLGPFEVSPGP